MMLIMMTVQGKFRRDSAGSHGPSHATAAGRVGLRVGVTVHQVQVDWSPSQNRHGHRDRDRDRDRPTRSHRDGASDRTVTERDSPGPPLVHWQLELQVEVQPTVVAAATSS